MSTLILDATTKTIKVAMSGAAATTNPDFVVSYADNNGTTFTEVAGDGALTGVTDVTIVAAPASGYRRVVKSILVQNRDTASVTILVKYDNNGTQRRLAQVTLQSGDTWSTDGTYDSAGALKQTLGLVNLASQVVGVLPVTSGGTGSTTSTGSGANVLANTPTLIAPVLGAATATTVNKVTLTAPATAATLSLAEGSTLATSGAFTATLTATGATAVTLPTTGTLSTLAGTETLTAKTLTNPTITNYVETPYVASTGTAITLALTNGTLQILTLTASTTITMPAAVAGKSFVIILRQDATGSRTVTWTTVNWAGGTAPTITSTLSKQDIFSFFSDGTSWYGATIGQNYTQ